MGGQAETGEGTRRTAPAASSPAGPPEPGDRPATGRAGAVLAASPPSIQRVFPPLLAPPELTTVSVARRRSLRLLLGVVVVAVVAGLVVSAVVLVGLVTRSDDGDDVETAVPSARQAPAGAVGQVLETPSLSEVLEERPTDGRLHGLARHVDVVAYGYADRVRLVQPGRPHGETVEAADGEHWLVAKIDTGSPPGMPTAVRPPADTAVALVVDGARIPVPIESSGIAAFSVPTDAEVVELVTTDPNLSQSWSFVSERRAVTTPDVLYWPADRRVARMNGTASLPYSASSPTAPPPAAPGAPPPAPGVDVSTAFGERSLTVEVAKAHLAYAVGVAEPDGSLSFHTASGPDRALLYLSGFVANWGGDDPYAYAGYFIQPEDAVVTLDDGSTVTATPLSRPEGATVAAYDLDERDPHEIDIALFDGALVWDVPAAVQRATLTIRPSPATALVGDRLDFRGGSVQFEMRFPH